ncbi:helix-turn-helix transcriptional regulator [Comamonas terrae]|uniref:XRE family transcriptional regulator n=1 Tax=Comamonas terrae TaxID=673548 RepID=A0ABW5UQD7_9BURK|nr:helix-turn-helix transcriptional regulator [Comamonas terrae]
MPRQNTPPADYPQAVLQQIEQLAQNIVIARKRRGESQAQWARKLGISQPTMARIERGDPSVAMASYVMCMWLINQAGGLADLIAPQNDHAALEKEVAKVRIKRKRAARPAHVARPAPLAPVALGKPQASISARSSTSPVAAGLAALLAGSKPDKK